MIKFRFIKCSAFVLVLLFVGSLFHGMMQAEAAGPREEIRKCIGEQLENKNRVRKLFYADYDKNGRAEAFVLTGPKKKKNEQAEAWTSFTLWFAYMEDGHVVPKQLRNDVIGASGFLKLKSVTLFRAQTYCTTSGPEDLYEVNGNDVKKIFHGDLTKPYAGDAFTSVHSTYDFMYDKGMRLYMGHTWKPYYFYYKGGKVYEYKAKKISSARFKRYGNGKKMLRKYRKYGKIKSIFYRENGLVHVNYNNGGMRRNVTFRVSGNRLKKPVVDEGIYRKRMPK